jgi:site-specific recombinase XerD
MPVNRKGKLWRARVTLPGTGGKMRSLGSFPTKTEALNAVRGAQAEINRGAWIDPRKGRLTLEEYWTLYTASARYQRKTKGSKDLDATTWRKHMRPAFGHRRLSSIRHSDCQDWIDNLAAEGYSAPTINRCHRTLRAVLNRAVFEERLVRNPSLGCDVPAVPLRDGDGLTDVIWDVPELRAIIDAHPERYRTFVTVMATCGLRVSEAVGLRWSNVDMLRRRLNICEAVTLVAGEFQRGPTKNKHSRVVAVPEFLTLMLAQHREQFGDRPDGAVFSDDENKLINRQWYLRSVFRPALKHAGVHHGTVHDLRHSASSIVTAGTSIEDAQAMLGHSDTRVTQRYTHTLERRREAVAAHLEELFVPFLSPDGQESRSGA